MDDVERDAVRPATLVRGVEAREDVARDRGDDVDRQAATLRGGGAREHRELHAVDPFHHQRRLVALDELEHADHVRVPDARAELDLVLEHGPRRRIVGEERVELLHGDGPALAALFTTSEVDGRHAADAQGPHDLEAARGVGHWSSAAPRRGCAPNTLQPPFHAARRHAYTYGALQKQADIRTT